MSRCAVSHRHYPYAKHLYPVLTETIEGGALSRSARCARVDVEDDRAPRHRPSRATAPNRHSVRVARAVHAYSLFIKIEVKRLRTLDRMLKAADAWTLAAAGWAASPMNQKNAPAGVTATATAGAAAALLSLCSPHPPPHLCIA